MEKPRKRGASPLLRARKLLFRRRFSAVLDTLLPFESEYEDGFDYFYLMGTASLYLGLWGQAETYYRKARRQSQRNVNMLLGMGVLFLRRGENDRALGCYLDVQEKEADNRIAKKALAFIKRHGGNEAVLGDWNERGRMRRFFPPLGMNPDVTKGAAAALLLIGAAVFAGKPAADRARGLYAVWTRGKIPVGTAEWTALELSVPEKKTAASADLSSGVFRYVLTDKEVVASYNKARRAFQQGRDNAAQVEINRILGSPASLEIRQKARLLMTYLREPTFDTLPLKDRYEYREVAGDPDLYLDCYVQWRGMVSNFREAGGKVLSDFLVGYDTRTPIEGIVPMIFDADPSLDVGRPLQVLAQVTLDGGKLSLRAKSLYQPIP